MKKTDTEVIIGLPQTITLELVPANELRSYEKYQWLTSPLSSIAVGFWTAFFTVEINTGPLLFSALTFTATSLLFIVLSYQQRKKIFNGKIERKKYLSTFNK